MFLRTRSFLLLLALIVIATETSAQPRMTSAVADGPVYWMPDTAADPHDKDFHLPIYVSLPSGSPGCNPDDMTVEVAFNATRFHPKSVTRGTIIGNTVAGGERVLTISLAGTAAVARGIVTEIVGDVLLGNIEITTLALRSVKCAQVPVADSIAEGYLRMRGDYCEEGSDRLLEYRAGFGITKIAPNPASGPVKLEILGVELAATSLELYSSFGDRVFSTTWTPASEGELRREVMLPGNLPGGLYEVVLRSPGRHDVQSLIIVR